MQATGRVMRTEVFYNWQSKTTLLPLVVDGNVTADVADLMECESLDIKVVKHRKKRSLDANALLWACLGDLASALREDKWQVYLEMLKRYGRYTYICVKPGVVDAVKAQWRECEEIGEIDINGAKAIQLLCYFGSSTYDTKEFSVLLDGVISEMKEIGLAPPPSKHVKEALEQWTKSHSTAPA